MRRKASSVKRETLDVKRVEEDVKVGNRFTFYLFIMWLTLLALRNGIGILMLSLAMVILGATSVQRLPVDLFPQIQVPVAFVGVIYKGAPPLDIEQSVVYPIEKAVSSASNVEHVESFPNVLRFTFHVSRFTSSSCG